MIFGDIQEVFDIEDMMRVKYASIKHGCNTRITYIYIYIYTNIYVLSLVLLFDVVCRYG